eukprot:gene15072-biopygen28836
MCTRRAAVSRRSLRRPRAAPFDVSPSPPVPLPELPAPGYGLAVDLALLPGHQVRSGGRKHRFARHDPGRWRDAGAVRVRDAGDGYALTFGELAQPLPAASVFRGVHPAFADRLSQAAALHARGALSLMHPPTTGAFTAEGGWRDPLLFARYYCANMQRPGSVGRRLPASSVLSVLREAMRGGAPPPPPPPAVPSDWADAALALDPSYITWTCDGPFPRIDNLSRQLPAWESLGAPPWLLYYLENGYRPHYHSRIAPVLPFGLGTAVEIFQKMMLLPARLIARDTDVIQYIDDTCGKEPSHGYPAIAAFLRRTGYRGPTPHPVAALLVSLGFVLGVPKCTFAPVPRLVVLGTELDCEAERFRVTPERLGQILVLWQEILDQARSVPIRCLARLAGLLISISIPVPVAVFFARTLGHAFGADLREHHSWSRSVPLPRWVQDLVGEFLDLLPNFVECPSVPSPPHFIIESDACDTGEGGVIYPFGDLARTEAFRAEFEGSDRALHINEKEARGLLRGVRALLWLFDRGVFPRPAGTVRVYARVDNTVLLFATRGGSPSARVQAAVGQIHITALRAGVLIAGLQYIPSAMHVAADELSRCAESRLPACMGEERTGQRGRHRIDCGRVRTSLRSLGILGNLPPAPRPAGADAPCAARAAAGRRFAARKPH